MLWFEAEGSFVLVFWSRKENFGAAFQKYPQFSCILIKMPKELDRFWQYVTHLGGPEKTRYSKSSTM